MNFYRSVVVGFFIVVSAIAVSCLLTGCQTTAPGMVGGKTLSMPPAVVTDKASADVPISTVLQPPNPLFLGKHNCTVHSAPGSGRQFSNPVWYRLEKNNKGEYLFYYNFSPARGNGLEGYFPAKLEGDKMSFVAPSGKTLQFSVKNGKVYFTSPTGEGDFEMATSK